MKIEDRCQNEHWNQIKVGSAEQFQSQERTVIIISTVRAHGRNHKLGFLNDPQVIFFG